jgi:hypothetical protein
VVKSNSQLPRKITSQFQELKFTLLNALDVVATEDQVELPLELHLTTSQLTPRLASTLAQQDNPPTTVTTLIQLQMLSKENSLILMQVLVNGGKSNSTDNTGSEKLEFETELIAAVID